MNQLVITHADSTTSVYPVTDQTIVTIDGQSVSFAGVTAVTVEAAPVEAPAVAETPRPEPQPSILAAVPDPQPADTAAPAEPAPAPEATPTPDPTPQPDTQAVQP